MVFSYLFSHLRPNDPRATSKTDGQQAGTRQRKHRCDFDQLEERTLLSTFTFATMGDSMTAPYSGYRASQGDRSWIQLLRMADGSQVTIDNTAAPGATSWSVLNNQTPRVVDMVKSQGVGFVVLEIGGNDISHYAGQMILGDFSGLSTTVSNIENSLTQIAQAGNVHEVLGLIPDVSLSPAVQARLGYNPILIAGLHNGIAAANQQLEAWALAHGVAVIDINAMFAQTGHPFNMDGYQITHDFFSPDGFHPGNVEQSMFANSVLTAFGRFGANVASLRLTDQFIAQISGNTTTAPNSNQVTYYNVNPFVIGPTGMSPAADATLVTGLGPSVSVPPMFLGYQGGPAKHPNGLLPHNPAYQGGPGKHDAQLPPGFVGAHRLPAQSVNLSQTLLPNLADGLDFVFADAA
jgi:hypothetical protein